MAPRKPPPSPLRPCLQMKVDELFLRWLSDPGTQRALRAGLRRIQGPAVILDHTVTPNPATALDPATEAIAAPAKIAPPDPAVTPNPAATAASTAITKFSASRKRNRHRAVPPRGEEPGPKAPLPGRGIPAFYFPRGRPGQGPDVDDVIADVERAFARLPSGRAGLQDMGVVAKACCCPLYWKAPLFLAAGGGAQGGFVSASDILGLWKPILLTCHDEAARFERLLGGPGDGGLSPEDLAPLVQDVADSHPGLSFLREAEPLRRDYVTTVTQRVFYTVNRSWSGRISCQEIRRSCFLQAVSQLEAEPDPGRATPSFFSYPHFCVIASKFQALDADGDGLIDRHDLRRHADGAISSRMIDRIFSGAVTRARPSPEGGKMGLADFVWFLLSEEDKTTPTSTEYWFRCMDLDGDGVLSAPELSFFYEEQAQNLAARGAEPPPFNDLTRQALDLVRPRCPGQITLGDLKRCGLAGEFFDAFFNADKFLEHERRDQAVPVRAPDADPTLSDWDRFAAVEYDFLLAEEAQDDDAWEEGSESLPSSPDPYDFADDTLDPL